MVDRGILLISGLSVVGIILGYWVYVTFAPSYVGAIFTGMCVISLLVAALAKPIGAALGNNDTGGTPDLDLKKQLLLGGLFGLAFILLASFSPFAIGIPNVQYSVGGNQFLAVTGPSVVKTVVAPLSEELFFLFVIPFLLYSLLFGYLRSKSGSVALTILLSGVIFALYHYKAYGGTLLLSAAFLAAGGFRVIVLIIDGVKGSAFKRGFSPASVAPTIVTAIVMHALFNVAVVVKGLVVAV
jgi:hypothetical protein